MKLITLIIVVTLASSLLLAGGCTSETKYGDCKGLIEDSEKDPALVYEMDVGNIVLAVVFSETFIVPAWVLITETYCPVDRKVAPIPVVSQGDPTIINEAPEAP